MESLSLSLVSDIVYIVIIGTFTLNAYRAFPFSEAWLGTKVGRWPKGFERFMKIAGPILIGLKVVSIL